MTKPGGEGGPIRQGGIPGQPEQAADPRQAGIRAQNEAQQARLDVLYGGRPEVGARIRGVRVVAHEETAGRAATSQPDTGQTQPQEQKNPNR